MLNSYKDDLERDVNVRGTKITALMKERLLLEGKLA